MNEAKIIEAFRKIYDILESLHERIERIEKSLE